MGSREAAHSFPYVANHMDDAYGQSSRRVIFSRCPTAISPSSSTFSALDLPPSYLTEPKAEHPRPPTQVPNIIRGRHCTSSHFAMAPVQIERQGACREYLFSNNALNIGFLPAVKQKVVYLRKVRGRRKRRQEEAESPVELKATKMRIFSPAGREGKAYNSMTPLPTDSTFDASQSPTKPLYSKSTKIHLFLGHKAIANSSFSIRRTLPSHRRYHSALDTRSPGSLK